MRLLNFRYREQGIILGDQLIFRCPKCQTFAIAITRPFVNLKRFCWLHQHGHCINGPGVAFVTL